MQAKFGTQMRQVKRVWMPATLLHSRKGLGHDFALPNVVRQRTVESHGNRKTTEGYPPVTLHGSKIKVQSVCVASQLVLLALLSALSLLFCSITRQCAVSQSA
jgi:hypothetical protein